MAMTIAAIRELAATESSDPLIAFLKIKTLPQRLVCNNTEVTNGYMPYPFDVYLPSVQDGDGQGAYTLRITFDNTQRLMVDYLRLQDEPVKMDLYLGLLSDPATKQVEFQNLKLVSVASNTKTCVCNFLVAETFNTQLPGVRYLAEHFPGANL